jgi:predicted acylesterase/phospholipase RssA
MKPLRKNAAISIDGGGIRGVMVTQALTMLEAHLGQSIHSRFRLMAGTSTGAIIAASIGAGLSADGLHEMYLQNGPEIFRQSWRTLIWPLLARYRYSLAPLEEALRQAIGDITMSDLWSANPPTDVVITLFDLVENRSRFVKSWKPEYDDWPVYKAVLASSSVPTYFPVVDGRYVDGGVGSYINPCYLAAYEMRFCLNWNPAETTLISLGTGRSPHTRQTGDADKFWAWNWLEPVLDAFTMSASDQQVHLVQTFFEQLDFRRFQVDMNEPISMDEAKKIPQLVAYGEELGRKILNDETDVAQQIQAAQVTYPQ